MNQSNLTQEETLQLASWLLSDETPVNSFSLMAVQGCFFALVCAPEPVEVEDWLTLVLPDVDVKKIPQDKIYALISIFSEVSDQVFEATPVLPAECELSEEHEANFLAGHPLHEWCYGFVYGASFYDEKLLDTLPMEDEITQAFNTALMTLSFFANKETAQSFIDIEQETDLAETSQQVYDIIPDFIECYAELVEQAAMATGLYDGDDDWG